MARLLVGWDGSETADQALEFAVGMAGKADELVVATIVPARLQDKSFLRMLFPQLEVPEELKDNSYEENAQARLVERVGAVEAPCPVRTVVRVGDPADELLDVVTTEGVDHLVIGYKSYEAVLPYHVGSVAEKLLRYCDVPITVFRPVPDRSD